MRAFVAGKGSVEVLGSKVNGEHGSIDGIILPSHFLCNSVDKGFLSSFHPWSTLHWNSSWLPWLPGYLMMVPWYGLTQNLCLWPPYIYLLRTMRSHTLQSDFSARNSPSQWWLCGLRHHNIPLCPSTWVSGCWRRPWYTFASLTPLCVWFWGVVIQGHGASSHDPQTFLPRPLFFDLYVPLQHSCLLHPCMNCNQTLLTPNLFLRVS